jgi:hypothetical protein
MKKEPLIRNKTSQTAYSHQKHLFDKKYEKRERRAAAGQKTD